MDRRGIMPTTVPFRSRALSWTTANTRSGANDWIVDWELPLILGFCVLGLLITFNLMLRFPDLGALIAQYNQI
jgi:hypothetical protein